MMHHPALTDEAVAFLLGGGRTHFIDCTFGGGGHTRVLLERAQGRAKILGVDIDSEAAALGGRMFRGIKNVQVIAGNFNNLSELILKWRDCPPQRKVDGIIADFGQSSDQLDNPARGFSHAFSGPLDMRYDRSRGETAAELINRLSQPEIAKIIQEYGGERRAIRIAAEIARRKPMNTTVKLADAVRAACGEQFIMKSLARVFMAFRVAVNRELDSMDEFLPRALDILRPGGRMVTISYDSSQDRRVKEIFKFQSNPCTCPPDLPQCVCKAVPKVKILTPRVIRPHAREISANPRSRSARLRAAEKL